MFPPASITLFWNNKVKPFLSFLYSVAGTVYITVIELKLLQEMMLHNSWRPTFYSNFGHLRAGNPLCNPVLSSCGRLMLPSKAAERHCGGETGQEGAPSGF